MVLIADLAITLLREIFFGMVKIHGFQVGNEILEASEAMKIFFTLALMNHKSQAISVQGLYMWIYEHAREEVNT